MEPDTSATQKSISWRLDQIVALDPLKICFIYLVFGIIWILCSDWLLYFIVPNITEYAAFSSVKGTIFVLVTAFLLFLLIRNFSRRLEEKNEMVRKTNEQLLGRQHELWKQNEALVRSHDEWETTYNALSDWICLISPDGKILKSNRAVESLFGMPVDRVVGRYCFEIVHGSSFPISSCPLPAMQKSRRREYVEIPKRQGDGWLQVSVDPLFDHDGNITGAVHVVRDISDYMLEQKALDLAKKKLNLLNHVTINEIQNTVFTLWGFQQFVKDRVTENPEKVVFAKEEDLINQISQSLKFAQTYQNLGFKPPVWQDVNRVFLLAISHLDFLAMKREVQLDDLELFADPLLEQVLMILADNTLVHGKKATRIKLGYTEGTDAVTLFFEDDGVGIPDKLKIQIFTPEFQKVKTNGLFLAKEILELTGITLRETGTFGTGARFEMVVPKGAFRFPVAKKKE